MFVLQLILYKLQWDFIIYIQYNISLEIQIHVYVSLQDTYGARQHENYQCAPPFGKSIDADNYCQGKIEIMARKSNYIIIKVWDACIVIDLQCLRSTAV